jgi:AdoMet-dependent heme synthase
MPKAGLIRKLALHRKRLKGLPVTKQVGYVAKTVVGQSIVRRGPGPFGPRLLEITLTHQCQCKCVHCYDAEKSAKGAHELTTAEVLALLKECASLGFIEVNLTGGEPLVRDDIIELVAAVRSLGMVPKMNTNGVLLNEEMVAKLAEAGLAWAAVSIDSPDPSRHDELRRYEGCFDAAAEGIKRCVKAGIPASITTYAARERIESGDLEKIVALGHDLGVDTVRILFPVPMGGFREETQQVLTREERERVRELLADSLVTMESPKEGSHCAAAISKVNVMPDGIVTPCVFVPLGYGNIRDSSFSEIWKRMAEFDKMYKPSGQCPMCNLQFRDRVLAASDEQAEELAS